MDMVLPRRNPVRCPSMSLALSFCNRSASTLAIHFSEQFLRRIGRKSLHRNRSCLLGTRPIDLLLVKAPHPHGGRSTNSSSPRAAVTFWSTYVALLCPLRFRVRGSRPMWSCGVAVFTFLLQVCKLPKLYSFSVLFLQCITCSDPLFLQPPGVAKQVTRLVQSASMSIHTSTHGLKFPDSDKKQCNWTHAASAKPGALISSYTGW